VVGEAFDPNGSIHPWMGYPTQWRLNYSRSVFPAAPSRWRIGRRPDLSARCFKAIARFIAPANMPSPLLWGDEGVVKNRFGNGVSDLKLTKRFYTFDYPFPPRDVVDLFRHYYGLTNRAFASLDDAGQQRLHEEL